MYIRQMLDDNDDTLLMRHWSIVSTSLISSDGFRLHFFDLHFIPVKPYFIRGVARSRCGLALRNRSPTASPMSYLVNEHRRTRTLYVKSRTLSQNYGKREATVRDRSVAFYQQLRQLRP